MHSVIVTAGLSNYKLTSKLAGLLHNVEVDKVFLVRKYPVFDASVKLVNINPSLKLLHWFPLFEIWRFFKLIHIARKHQITAVIGIQLVLHGVQASLCSFLTGIPSVLSVIGDDVHKHLTTPIIKSLLKPFVLHMKCITVMGNKSKSIINNLNYKQKSIIIIQNYQQRDKFKVKNLKKKWDLIFIGDLIGRKCIPDLLISLSKCKAKYLLAIVGDGPEKNRLIKLVHELGIEQQVDFIGETNNVENYLNQSKIMVLPSKLEALPAVSVESMYCGVPCILTSICDIPTYFSHEQGCLLYPAGDVNALQHCIESLLKDKRYYEEIASHCAAWSNKHKLEWSMEQQCHIWSEILSRHVL